MSQNIIQPYRFSPASAEIWAVPSVSTVQIGLNGSSWRGLCFQTTGTTTFLGKTLTKLTLNLFSFDSGSASETFSVGRFDTSGTYSSPLGTLTGSVNNNNQLTGVSATYEFTGNAGVISSGDGIGIMIDRSDGVSINLVQVITSTSNMPTGCSGTNYSQTSTQWNADSYSNDKAPTGQGYGY